MSTINAYGLDAVVPYVLAVQLVGGAVMYRLGRWRWLGAYPVTLLPIWFFSLMLYSAHCLTCGEGIWFGPMVIVFLSVIAKVAIVSRPHPDETRSDDA